jgi:hypothetical protein
MSKKNSIWTALIHNKNVQRNAIIQPVLKELRIFIGHKFNTGSIEISVQPEIKPHNTLMALFRRIIMWKLNREWVQYRCLRSTFIVRDFLRFGKEIVKEYIFDYKKLNIWKRNSFVETLISDKHIRAWNAFLETDGDFLICFEDDIVCQEGSIQKISNLLDLIMKKNLNSLLYVDLAGGCKLAELKIGNLETGNDGSYRYYDKPVTNTTCGYLISRSLVINCCEIIVRKPWIRLIGADWMMNRLFIEMEGQKIICLHSDPSIFQHGTVIGKYSDWRG